MPTAAATPDTWGDLLIVPENRSAVRAAGRLANGMRSESSRLRFARPLVFHGPTGFGKSAVVKGLVRQVIETDTPRTVRVTTAAELPRELAEIDELRACDLLAVEDVQHLKPADVETLLVLLDTRSARRRPTVVTAHLGPAHLTELPRRLTNRLAAGLVVRLDPFGLASRKRFATMHAGRSDVRLSADALDWLARTADSLRHLAGRIDTLRFAPSAGKGELTAPAVQQLLADPLPPTSLLDRITRTVAQAYRVKPKDVLGASRLRTVLVPRQVAMYLAREVARLPLTVIGGHFGRDHSTVLNSVRKITAAIGEDEELAGRVRELSKSLE